VKKAVLDRRRIAAGAGCREDSRDADLDLFQVGKGLLRGERLLPAMTVAPVMTVLREDNWFS
jgi:hypothetical protein